MSLASRVGSLAARVAEELNTVRGEMGTDRQKLAYKSTSMSLSMTRADALYVEDLEHIQRHGGSVTLCPLVFIDTATSSTFTRPTQARFDWFFALAASYGVEITMIKPHIVTVADGDAFYRMNYQPADNAAFFANWQVELEWFANLCEQYSVPALCVTVEQGKQTNPNVYSFWPGIITAVRNAGQPGLQLTCAFTTLELFDMDFTYLPAGTNHVARLLDFIGINSWVKTTSKVWPNLTKQDIDAGWNRSAEADYHLQRIHIACNYLQKPYMITEVGCRPWTDGPAVQSGGTPSGSYGHEAQALLYTSILDVLTNSDWCLGVAFWHVSDPFNYFIRNDPDNITATEEVLIDYFLGGIV